MQVNSKRFGRLLQLDKEVLVRHLESTLAERSLLRKALDNARFGFAVTDSAHRLLEYNAFWRMFMRPKANAPYKVPLLELVPKGSLYRKIRKHIIDNHALNAERVLFPLESRTRIGSLSSYSMTAKGKLEGFVYVLVDNTPWNERSLVENHNKSLDSLQILTASLAHEVKNPLGALDLHVQLLLRFLAQNNFKERPEILKLTTVLQEELARLDGIVNDFLFAIRPAKPVRRPADLNALVSSALRVVAPELDKHGILLVREFSPSLPPYPFDEGHMKQVVINLVKNAVEAVLEVEDSEPRIVVGTEFTEGNIVFRVSDNGKGMNRSQLERIFEPFYSSKETGTGLGLTISSKIVREHEGEIVVESTPNQGTDIRVEFALRSERPKLVDANSQAPKQQN